MKQQFSNIITTVSAVPIQCESFLFNACLWLYSLLCSPHLLFPTFCFVTNILKFIIIIVASSSSNSFV
jgi:hypothetical protein